MIINGVDLVLAQPIKDMLGEQKIYKGTSYGLSDIGYDIRTAETIKFDPGMFNGKFRLASSMEYFQMPEDLCASVCDKSTWARRGISVFNTLIKPGWEGYLTIELSSCSDEAIVIEEGCAIAQIIFQKVSRPTWYKGIYQNQEAGPQEARLHPQPQASH